MPTLKLTGLSGTGNPFDLQRLRLLFGNREADKPQEPGRKTAIDQLVEARCRLLFSLSERLRDQSIVIDVYHGTAVLSGHTITKADADLAKALLVQQPEIRTVHGHLTACVPANDAEHPQSHPLNSASATPWAAKPVTNQREISDQITTITLRAKLLLDSHLNTEQLDRLRVTTKARCIIVQGPLPTQYDKDVVLFIASQMPSVDRIVDKLTV